MAKVKILQACVLDGESREVGETVEVRAELLNALEHDTNVELVRTAGDGEKATAAKRKPAKSD